MRDYHHARYNDVRPAEIACEYLADFNMGSIVRTANGFGVRQVAYRRTATVEQTRCYGNEQISACLPSPDHQGLRG